MTLIDLFLFISILVFLGGFLYFLRTQTMTKKFLAIDFLSLISASIMTIYAVKMDNSLYLDIVMVWALVNFLGTVAFSIYLNNLNQKKIKHKGSSL